jgi:putative tricarboxylic transport membrane protein
MLDNFAIGFNAILAPSIMFMMLCGTFIGIVFGSVPGLTATMAVVLCLPVTYGMEPIPSMCLLLSLYIGGISGGLISAILLKIPGTPASIATTFDGNPMAERGEAKKALSAGVWFSFLGGIFSLLVLFFVSPPLARIAVGFTPFDYFSVILFSLIMIAGLSGKSLAKGILCGLLGMTVSFIGSAPIDGLPRFTFGLRQLEGGFTLLPTLMGIFAASEILGAADAMRKAAATPATVIAKDLGNKNLTLSEMTGQWFNFLRSSVIGTAIGIMPGVGGGVSNLISYTVAQRQSRYPEKFGTGILDGIVAPETANNASIGGAMVPLLSLGIPGDAVTAILIGALMIHGISPGPLMFRMQTDLIYSIFAALIVAHFMMLGCMLFFNRFFIKLLDIPKALLLPMIFTVCIVGAFGVNNRIFDVWTVLVFGLVGYTLRLFRIPTAPFLLGIILGPFLEENLRRGLMHSKGSIAPFFTNPISCAFLAITLLSVAVPVYRHLKNKMAAK